MSVLILIDKATGLELGRCEMQPSERFGLSRDDFEGDLLRFQGCYDLMHTAAWCLPQEDFVASVTFRSCESDD
jgi:hypothetical protein